MSDAAAQPDATPHGAHVAHHFQTAQQQAAAGKLGMWVFLATELLMFGGLFCAYAVYRANHPEVFFYASRFLDVRLGGINTAILIASSFTMAWAVRAAQLDQRRLSALCLALTIAGGLGFMGIKYVEYRHKWHEGLLWGARYHPVHAGAPETRAAPPASQPLPTVGLDGRPLPPPAFRAALAPPAPAPAGRAPPSVHKLPHSAHLLPEPRHVAQFFSIYFAMTGLHALHVLVGLGLIGWILLRTLGGTFSAAYNLPVDLVGLYWHLVDLIWIFLFPLLYLIH